MVSLLCTYNLKHDCDSANYNHVFFVSCIFIFFVGVMPTAYIIIGFFAAFFLLWICVCGMFLCNMDRIIWRR